VEPKDFEYTEGDIVYWNVESTKIPVGKGIIRGVATTGAGFIGKLYIVEVGDKLQSLNYPYSCCVVFEVNLSKNP
jgi:hypothetical protein